MPLRLRPGHKIWGGNLSPIAGQGWLELFRDWPWATWIRPQIEHSKGNGLGINCVRLIGHSWSVYLSLLSQEEYDNKQLQLAKYLLEQDMYYYPCMGGIEPSTVYWSTPTINNRMADIFASTLIKLQQFPNVIGCDLIQETSAGNYGMNNAASMVTLLKQRGVTLPLTCSTAELVTPGAGGPDTNIAAQVMDFVDIHCYGYTLGTGPQPPNLLQHFLTNWPQQDIIFGEFGTSQGADAPFALTFEADCANIANQPHPRVRGALAWAIADQDLVTNGLKWGIWDTSTTPGVFVPRQHRLNRVRMYTGGKSTYLS